MLNTILLAAALQDWETYSAYALTAREVAAELALGASRRLHVLSVYHHDAPLSGRGISPELMARHREDMMSRITRYMEQTLDAYVAPLKDAGLEVNSILEAGNPREVIIQVANRLAADLLVIGSHSKRGLFDVVLGGTARQVSSHAPCPLVLVSPKP